MRLCRADTTGFALRFGAETESLVAKRLCRHGLARGAAPPSRQGCKVREGPLLNILIVEDEPLLAETLRRLIELTPRFRVPAIADDTASALAAAEARPPDLALVDLQLANATSGFSVAAKLHERGIACLFTTGRVPGFPLPDLAIGCPQEP